MKKWLFAALPVALLMMACNNNSSGDQEEKVELKTSKDRLSYALGSISAQSFVKSEDENLKKLDIDLMVKGFKSNLNEDKPEECEDMIKKLFGPYFQDFDTTYAKKGSECIGRMTAFTFYRDVKRMGGINELDMDMVATGFRHALNKNDTLITEEEREEIVTQFISDLNTKKGDEMMVKAKKIPGAQVMENGIVIVPIKEGTGGSPGPKDDVEVEYVLMSASGDTIQSSYEMKKMRGSTDPVALSLDGGVIEGWTYALPKMKKGGKYDIYVPWNLAYGEQGGKESLHFTIDLINYGEAGSLVKPMPQQMPAGY